jgi:hypothetical protein
LTKLKILRVHDNDIADLAPLYGLFNLEQLWASSNNVRWEDVIYLSSMKNLSALLLENNPCEEKDRFEDFVSALLPSLRLYNGKELQQSAAQAEFMRSVIGRQMITQARATMSSSQRQALTSTSSGKDGRPPLAQNNRGRRTTMPERSTASSNASSEASAGLLYSEEEPMELISVSSSRTGTSASSATNTSASHRRTGKTGGTRAARSTAAADGKIPRGASDPLSLLQSEAIGTLLEELENSNDDGTERQETFSDKLRKSIEIAAKANKESEPFLVRFQGDDSSPIAFCLHEDRSGYAK